MNPDPDTVRVFFFFAVPLRSGENRGLNPFGGETPAKHSGITSARRRPWKQSPATPAVPTSIEHEASMSTTLSVNGVKHTVDLDPDTPLLWVLRDALGLTGTKFGCGVALCGACTVHIDGVPRRSCITPLSSLGTADVRTIEALHEQPAGRALQKAWLSEEVVQCGYCQSGQLMSAAALLAANASPSDGDIDAAMSGNICRCGTYGRIRGAIHVAARSLGGAKGGEA